MFKKFTVGNFLSFHHHQSFTMASESSKRVNNVSNYSINQFSAIFGEHKEDFFTAIKYAKTIFLEGTQSTSPPFCSSAQISNKEIPSSFDFEIYLNGATYSIGFEVDTTSNEIVEQWLLQIDKGKKEILYYYNRITGNHTYKEDLFSNEEFSTIVEKKGLHTLLVSEFAIKKVLFSSIMNWFSTLVVIPNISSYQHKTKTIIKLEDNNQTILKIFEGLFRPVIEGKFSQLEKLLEAEPTVNVAYLHENLFYMRLFNGNETVWFEICCKNYSKEISSLLFLLLSMEEGIPVFVNIVENILAPSLLTQFITYFFSIGQNKEVQLVIGTEETTLLNTNFLKKNEMWFVTQGDLLASRLISYDCFFFEEGKDIAAAYKAGEFSYT
ncbi:MAG: hypothetical protein EOM67_10605 [Spirochaetia bacterium]|nr:hypothetical protein [Spirochaetia bacterium]